MEKKKSYKLKRIILALSKAAQDVPIRTVPKKPKIDKRKSEIEKKRLERQRKVERLRNLEKARLKRQYIILLNKKLLYLENTHKKMKRSKKHKKSDLNKIEKKINELKKKIKGL